MYFRNKQLELNEKVYFSSLQSTEARETNENVSGWKKNQLMMRSIEAERDENFRWNFSN